MMDNPIPQVKKMRQRSASAQTMRLIRPNALKCSVLFSVRYHKMSVGMVGVIRPQRRDSPREKGFVESMV